MQIISEIVELENIGNFSVEYIETQLKQKNIVPLRWAIVDIQETIFLVNVAFEKLNSY